MYSYAAKSTRWKKLLSLRRSRPLERAIPPAQAQVELELELLLVRLLRWM